MPQKILKLPESVINQIAAGEVVENPASIVKELLENSLDAGATKISIEVRGGGAELIRIEDNGWGMSLEDAALCLERHATSKIRTVDDLSALVTMGFRGEAIAAIASVSHFELKTSTGGVGTRILVEGGQKIAVEPCARNQGTTIEIRSLFFNTPARKKFQKSAQANRSHVTKIVETIALAHPDVSFALSHNGEKTFEVTAQDWKQRIEKVLGDLEHPVHFEEGSLVISGLIAAPELAMANRTGQYFFVNQRPIFSPLISRAVKDGFGTRIAEKTHPSFVLYLQIPPDWVDVNVHPQKKEARFRDDSLLYRAFREAVSHAFASPHSFSEPLTFTRPAPSPSFLLGETEPVSKTVPNFVLSEGTPELELYFSEQTVAVFGSFLLLRKEHLLLVDLKAAHARVLFESLTAGKGTAQTLIWPIEIEIRPGEEEIAAELSELGIECRLLGKTLAIDALPSFLEAAHFPSFLASWKEGRKIEGATSRFCRNLKKIYTVEEATLLWRKLQTCGDTCYDPSGNRIWREIKDEDLERMMKNAH